MRVILFGPGYCGQRIAALLERHNLIVTTIGRGDADVAAAAIPGADVIVSTVPPGDGDDPIVARHGAALGRSGARLVYLSSTGVYGDAGGAWVDESAPLVGRRPDRIAADQAWSGLGAAVLRLPGIYGPGRSVVDRLLAGNAHRVDVPGQVFSRIHVEDVASAVLAAARAGATATFNIADDLPCAQAELVAWAAPRLGIATPPLQPLATAGLSPAARAFYAENRRVAAGKARRLLGWQPRFPDYRAGLGPLLAAGRS